MQKKRKMMALTAFAAAVGSGVIAAQAREAAPAAAASSTGGGVAMVGGSIRPDATMLQYPDVSATHIVFSYANDLWLVPRTGGTAVKLASPPGQETFPRFSPDGKTIGFVGNYEGNKDLYTIPADPAVAGMAFRVTHHPAGETLSDWTPDGKLLFYTTGFGGLARQNQLMTVAPTGGLPEKLPVPYGAFSAISPDGTWLAYTPHTTDFRTWKRYRGGMATDIWLFNLKDKTSKKATDWEGTDTAPMWAPGSSSVLYYLSDAGKNHRLNIWSFDVGSGKRSQLTDFDEYDVKWPSIGPGTDGKSGEIVFQNGPRLFLLDLKSGGKPTAVDVVIPGDRPTLRQKLVDFGNFTNGGDLSPSGKRVVVEARGDLWSLPAEKGFGRAITRTNGVAERNPSYSPDGKWISYLSDATGEYEIYVVPADGKGEAKQLTTSGQKGVPEACYRYIQAWSPDSKLIAWNDKTGTYFLTNAESGETVKVAQDPWDNYGGVSFSGDSQWMAITLTEPNANGAIYLYNVGTKELTRVTDPMFAAGSPTFDRKGEYLYFTSRRKFSPTYSELDTSFIYKDSSVMLVAPLRKDIASPFAPKNDDEGADKDKKDEKKDGEKKDGDDAKKSDDSKKDEAKKDGDAKDSDKKDADGKDGDKKDDAKKEDKKPDPVKIDLDGLERRAIELPLPPGNYGNLIVGDGGKLFFLVAEPPDPDADEQRAHGVIKMFDVSDEGKDGKRTAKVVLGKSDGGFGMSADGKKLLVFQDKDMAVIDAAADQKFEKKVPKDSMKGEVDPRTEWNQIFTEAWRLQRDFFYVPNMHGVDWPLMRKRYQAMLADCVTRDDVNFVLKELISEINVGHAYILGPGEVESGPSVGIGMLGCDYELAKGTDATAYKIAKIYEGGPFDSDARGPLSQPGVKVKEGDYLLAINGVPVNVSEDPWAALVGLAGKTVQLTVASKPSMVGTGDDAPREVLVKTMDLGGEMNLRYRAWIETNRQYVAYKSDGKVGYVYVPNTGVDGQNDLIRQFFGQNDKSALIIDERWNGGGQIPTRFIELLNRPVMNYYARRDGKDWPWPPDGHQGPKCMLINGLAGSGGDCFPWLFKQNKIGKLIGMRTWGGLVGISGNPGFIDGGSMSVPTFGFYKKDGTWGIEGHGVDPDMLVVDDPAKMQNGGDPQLDAAIEEMLAEIKSSGYNPPKRPTPPDRSGMGLPEKDR